SKMYELYPKGTTVVFLFLILPSIPVILKGEKFFKKDNLIAFFGGVAFTGAFMFLTKAIAGEEIARTAESLFTIGYGMKLFLCGLVAAGAMVIPGISGSLLLILLGEYYNILGYIKSFAILPLIFFAAGTGIGLVLVSKGINILLNRYRSYTLNFIVGIIIVSLFEIIQTLFI
ncbi:MAG: undecaprenyl phosphate translocase family protein, partial [Cetobacterium sp.]